jgi:DMSO/TMAO reductase YedYZ molybdopterin-dependent catalytic subunit
LFESLEELKKNRRAIRRRRFLATGLAGVACYFGWRWWRFRPQPVPQIDRPFITPNEEFFRISIQPGFRPEIDLKEWRLTLTPPRGSSIALSYEDLRKLGGRQIPRTLMCVGNPIGGGGLGNAVWTGVSLRPLLEKICDPKSEKLRVVFRAMDGFHSSVPLEAAMDPDTYLVYEMNGEPLPAAHGYPLRVLIPGKYGMKQPRWLQEIKVTSGLALGYWERWGWSNDCEIRMTAHIDSVVKISETERRVSGIAFCGREAVGRVEVSDDEGDSWMGAQLRETPLPGVWCGWDFLWRPRREDQYVLTARVVDALGTRQIESYSGSYPSGSTGLHRVIVDA